MKLGSKPGLAAGLAVVALATAAPASAAPVTVDLRIEGPNRTVFEGPVTTDVRTFHFTGDIEHECDNGAGAVTRGAVITAAADSAPFTMHGMWFAGLGPSFEEVGGENVAYDSATDRFLVEYENGVGANVGACQDPVQDGDRVLFAYAKFGDTALALSGPASAHAGDTVTVTVTVTDAGTGAAVPDAEVAGTRTAGDGTAKLALAQAGTSTFKATKPNTVRSNALTIQVVAPDQPLPPSGGSVAAPDRLAPLAKLLGIADHQTFAKGKGPRTLRASVSDTSGLAAVKLRLTRRSGGRCFYFSGKRQELERTRCGRAFFFKVGDSPDVSYLLPERLGPGRYVLDIAAVDRAGNRSALARGSTRVVFTVR